MKAEYTCAFDVVTLTSRENYNKASYKTGFCDRESLGVRGLIVHIISILHEQESLFQHPSGSKRSHSSPYTLGHLTPLVTTFCRTSKHDISTPEWNSPYLK